MISTLILAACKFFLVPFLIGRALYLLFAFIPILQGRQQHLHDSWWRTPWYFAGGELFIFAFALFFHYMSFIPSSQFFSFLYQTITYCFYFSFLLNFISLFFIRWRLQISNLVFIATIFALAFSTYYIWLAKSPQPLNWDYYQHQLLADDIRLGQFSFFINEISDTFGFLSYPPAFHLNLALAQGPQQLDSLAIIDFWQYASFIHLLLFLFATLAFTQSLFQSKKLTFLALFIAAFVFDSAVSFTSLFLLPQTFTAVWSILLFADLIHRGRTQQSISWWLLPLGLFFTILNHFVIGTFAALCFVGTFIYWRFPRLRRSSFQPFLLLALIFLTLAGVFISYRLDLSAINRGEAANYIFDLSTTLTNLYRFYGFLGLILILAGFALTAIRFFRRPTAPSCFFLGGFLISTGILFSHFPYAAKFFTLFRFFYDLSAAIALLWFLQRFRHWRTKIIIFAFAVGAFFINFVANCYYWKIDLNYQGQWTHSTAEDAAIADFLWQRYSGQSVLLISDPATQHILEGLSGVNSAGGAYGTRENRTLIANLYRSTSIENFLCSLINISDSLTQTTDKKLLALSGRSFLWLQSDLADKLLFNYNVWSPNNLSLRNLYFIESLKKSPKINAIYESPYMVILEVDLSDPPACQSFVI